MLLEKATAETLYPRPTPARSITVRHEDFLLRNANPAKATTACLGLLPIRAGIVSFTGN